MRKFLIAGALAALTAALPATAQQTAPNAAPNAAPNPVPSLPTQRADARPGQPYLVETHGDWTLRCIRVETAAFDPCEIHQVVLNSGGAPTAEFSLFPLQDATMAAGGTIITPLETLLTRGLAFSTDGGTPLNYPFQFCNRQGCVAQLGLSAAEIDAMRAGAAGSISIYPAVSPDQRVDLPVSLKGFTKAMEALLLLPLPQ